MFHQGSRQSNDRAGRLVLFAQLVLLMLRLNLSAAAAADGRHTTTTVGPSSLPSLWGTRRVSNTATNQHRQPRTSLLATATATGGASPRRQRHSAATNPNVGWENYQQQHPLQGSSHFFLNHNIAQQASILPERRRRGDRQQSSAALLCRASSSSRTTSTATANNKVIQASSSSSAVLDSQQQQSPSPMVDTSTANDKNPPPQNDAQLYQELGLAGKIVAGATEFTLVVALDYLTGFLTGYVAGSVLGWAPPLVRRKFPQRFGNAAAAPTTTSLPFRQKVAQWHQRSTSWGTKWGGLQAAFSGSNVGARLLRNGVEDEFTSVLSSMALGAYFSRNEGPVGMAKGAILYGGIVYLLSAGGSSNKKNRLDNQPPPQPPVADGNDNGNGVMNGRTNTHGQS